MKLFLVLLACIVQKSWALTCSAHQLNAIYVRSPVETKIVARTIVRVLNEELSQVSKKLDQKGFSQVSLVDVNYGYGWYEVISAIKNDLPDLSFKKISLAFLSYDIFRALYPVSEYERIQRKLESNFSEYGFRDYHYLKYKLSTDISGIGDGKKIIFSSNAGALLVSGALSDIKNRGGTGDQRIKRFMPVYFGPVIDSKESLGANTNLISLTYRGDSASNIGNRGLPLPHNYTIPVSVKPDPYNILTSYLNNEFLVTSTKDQSQQTFTRHLLEALIGGVESFPNDDVNCCNKRIGRLWKNESGCEPNEKECLGGFIEDTVKLSLKSKDELQVSSESVICEDIEIKTSFSSVKIINSKLRGAALISGDVELTKVHLDATNSYTKRPMAFFVGESKPVLVNLTGSTLAGSNIVGRPNLSEGVSFISNKSEIVIEGDPTIVGDATITNSKIIGEETFSPAIDASSTLISIIDSSLSGNTRIEGLTDLDNVVTNGAVYIKDLVGADLIVSNAYQSVLSKPGIKLITSNCLNRMFLANVIVNDEADVEGCGNISNQSVLSGHVRVRGKFGFNKASLIGDAYQPGIEPMIVNGNIGNGIFISDGSKIHNRPKIEGSMIIDGLTEIYQNGSYKGVTQIVGSGGTEVSHIKDAILQGNNMKMSGLYYVETAMLDAEVVGGYAQLSSPSDWVFTTVFKNTAIEPEAKIKGLVVIKNGARLGYRSIAEGKKLGSKGGVTLDGITLFTGEGKTVEGGVYLGGVDVDGANIKSNVNDQITTFTSGFMRNGEIESGYGTITGSGLTGARIFGGTGYRIESAQLNGTSVTGSAYLCSKTYGVFTYDSSYDCTLDETVIPFKTGDQLMFDAREEARRKVQYENRKSLDNRKRIAKQMAMKLKLLKQR